MTKITIFINYGVCDHQTDVVQTASSLETQIHSIRILGV